MPRASAIVRVKDEASTLGRTLHSLRSQTVVPEIVVVDSGSRDGSVEIARELADVLVEIEAGQFTYGRALNLGAARAASPIHIALSSHCTAPHPRWVERTLEHYEDPTVGGVCGAPSLPDGTPLVRPFRQDAAHARAHPFWGFSNHASSWRAAAWEDCPFDETLDYAEDKEWAHRALGAGWALVFDDELWVDMSHGWQNALDAHRRQRRSVMAIAGFTPLPRYGLRDLAREWWTAVPDDRHRPAFHRFVNYRRLAALAGRYRGHAATRGPFEGGPGA